MHAPIPSSPRTPEDTCIYAVGDIHGCLDALKSLQENILRDADHSSASQKIIIYLGDYIDRGLNSKGAIDWLIEHPLNKIHSLYLMGNHEYAMLAFLQGQMEATNWLMWGAAPTFTSYGVSAHLAADPTRQEEARNALKLAVPKEHLAFLQGLQLMHVTGDYVFVHAGLKPGIAIDQQDEQDLLFIREDFLSSPVTCGKIVVHGHTIMREARLQDGKIGVDTGAYATNRLTAVKLEGEKIEFISSY